MFTFKSIKKRGKSRRREFEAVVLCFEVKCRLCGNQRGVQLLVCEDDASARETETSSLVSPLSEETLYNQTEGLSCALFQVSCCLVACQLGQNTRHKTSPLHHQPLKERREETL